MKQPLISISITRNLYDALKAAIRPTEKVRSCAAEAVEQYIERRKKAGKGK
jgi:metal-responsive CopG/Arc/MetJ family transcriptional regulator